MATVLVGRLPSSPYYYKVLTDAAHGPAFAALTFLLLRMMRPLLHRTAMRAIALAWLLAIAIGILVEWVQGIIGRDSSWSDVRTDVLGASLAALLALYNSRTDARRLWRGAALAAAMACAIAICYPLISVAAAYWKRQALFPVLFDAAAEDALYFAQVNGAVTRTKRLGPRYGSTGDATSLELVTTGSRYPGLALTEPVRNWQGYSTLNLDITNPESSPLPLTIRVHDLLHDNRFDDRFNTRIVVESASRRIITISLDDVRNGPSRRALDLGNVGGMIVFCDEDHHQRMRKFDVTRIWLE